MFRLKFAQMYDNTIFQKYQEKPVVEDYFLAKDTIFCVADGVTRDSIKGEAIPYPKNKKEVQEWIKAYPNPSGAYEAAKICVEYFVKHLQQYPIEKRNEEVLLQIVEEANQEIGKINRGRKIDYLANDLFGCVAVGGCIANDVMYCFSIGDCHIATFDENFEKRFETLNNHTQFEIYLEEIYCKKHPYDWNNAKDRVMVRKEYRNKPNKKYEGKEISFGVLTGEKEAEHYIDVYQVNLEEVKYICAYSDGCEPFFATKDKVESLIRNPQLLQQEGKERTLIIYEK